MHWASANMYYNSSLTSTDTIKQLATPFPGRKQLIWHHTNTSSTGSLIIIDSPDMDNPVQRVTIISLHKCKEKYYEGMVSL